MPALSPVQSNTPTWFTEGDKNKGISWIGQDWLNILQAELLNILDAAGIKPDKGKLNQLTLSVKAIITANAYTQANNLKEIFDAGIAAQAAARGHLGLGKLATKDSLGPTDVNALAKDQNLADVPDKAAGRASLDVYSKTESNENYMAKSQNGADIPDKPKFIQNVGLKETLNPTKRVSIGNIGNGAFDGSVPCINIGDSDSGFIGSADGIIDIYCNNAKVGYIDPDGLHMNTDVSTNRNIILRGDDRKHIIMQDADSTPRMYIFKDKGGDGVHLNNGTDASTEYLFHKDGSFYAPLAVRAGGSKKLAVRSDNNSALSAHFNLWGDANRPTVIELDDDQGWHLYSQRNPDGSIRFMVNGEILANGNIHAGANTIATDGNIFGTRWNPNGAWLWDTIVDTFSRKNTASLETNGWFKDASTGLIVQWGITGGNLNKAVVNLPIPFPNAGLWSLGWVAGTLDMGNDDWSNSASLLNNSQLTVTTDHWWSTAWIAIGK
ncbi:hypothetical protein ABWQ78_003762 [Salmonella enterica subsp. enterica serovar Newport]